MTHDTHLFSVCLCVFKCNDSSLSKLKFISQKNFYFICQNCAFLRRAQTHVKTHEKKNPDHIFFLCAYAFSSAKIHLSQNLNSSLRKTLILFVKTVHFCAAHKRMKRHMRKKFGSHLFSVRLCVFKCKDSSQNLNSSLRKTLILYVKTVRFCAAHKRMKIHMRKKNRITCFFRAPMRFQVQRFTSLILNSSLKKL